MAAEFSFKIIAYIYIDYIIHTLVKIVAIFNGAIDLLTVFYGSPHTEKSTSDSS